MKEYAVQLLEQKTLLNYFKFVKLHFIVYTLRKKTHLETKQLNEMSRGNINQTKYENETGEVRFIKIIQIL